MQTKYCIMPDEEKFFAFLSAQSFTESELLQLRLMHINQICVDETTRQWVILAGLIIIFILLILCILNSCGSRRGSPSGAPSGY